MELKISLSGKAQAQERPKFSTIKTKDGRILTRAFDPKNSKNYKAEVKIAAANCMKEQNWNYTDLPLEVEIVIYKELTKTQLKSKKFMKSFESGAERPTTKPDVDNVAKCVIDGLTKVAFRDDNQIVRLVVSKYYTAAEPHVEVTIKVWGW